MKNSLRYYRNQAKLSQEELGEATGFGTSTIGNVETGRTQGSEEFWEAMAKALHVAKEDLIRELPILKPEMLKDLLKGEEAPEGSYPEKLEQMTRRAIRAEEKVEVMKKILRSLLDQL